MAEEILVAISSSAKLQRDRGIVSLEDAISSNDSSVWEPVLLALSKITADSDVSWEEKHGFLLAQKCLISTVKGQEFEESFCSNLRDISLKWLTDGEVRVRTSAGECLGALCLHFGEVVYRDCKEVVLKLITNNLERKMDVDNESGMNEIQETEKLMEKLVGKSTGEAAQVFHDTAGWKNLETSMKCLQCLVEGCGVSFHVHVDEQLLGLIFTCLTHTNRFVRETGFQVCSSIISVCSNSSNGDSTTSDGMEVDRMETLPPDQNPVFKFGPELSRHLASGLADNWSQVRLAASTAVKEFLLALPPSSSARKMSYPLLLPRLCLNRYYLAEGVRIFAQNTWKQVAGSEGRVLVETYISDVVSYYVECTVAENHAVREAACQCIAELAVKIGREVLRPYVDKLLEALIECFQDESWPVRDMACVASGSFMKCFPDQSKKDFPKLFPLFIDNLRDPISSVRQGAAIALANSIRAFGNDAVQPIVEKIKEGLTNVKNQQVESEKYGTFDTGPAEFGVAKRLRDNDPAIHENQTMFSCGSLAPKMGRKGGGGCGDCKFRKPSEPWEFADGCIHLVAEMSTIKECEEEVTSLLPIVSDACRHKHYALHLNLMGTVCGRLPDIAKNINKRNFKPALEDFIEVLFYSLDSDSALASSSAEQCMKELSKQLGPNIFRGRVEMYNPGYAEILDRVLGQGGSPRQFSPGPGRFSPTGAMAPRTQSSSISILKPRVGNASLGGTPTGSPNVSPGVLSGPFRFPSGSPGSSPRFQPGGSPGPFSM